MSFKNKTNQKFISALLIIILLTPVGLFSMPKKVLAQSPSSVSTCATIIAKVKARQTVDNVTGATSVPVKETNSPKIAGNTDAQKEFKLSECINEALKELLKVAARRLLAKMTEATVSWINSGFHGSPLFVENPGSFFKDIAKSEIRQLVNLVGYNSTSFPFGKNAALNTISSYKSTFAQNAQYSLSKVTSDANYIQRFQNDFSVGGWDGFLLQTQFPQNNPIGFNMMYSEELAKALAGAEPPSQGTIIKDTLSQGQGFLSPQRCATNESYNNLKNQFQQPNPKPPVNTCGITIVDPNNPTPEELSDEANCLEEYEDAYARFLSDNKKNFCPNKPDGSSGFERTTPGSVVANQIMNSLVSPLRQGELSAAMGNSLSAIFDALINKFMSSGLNALSNKINSIGSGGGGDDFSYDGQTLGTDPGTTSGGTGFNWNSPDQVITLGGVKTNVQSSISNIVKELLIINNINSTITPGIFQTFEKIWPKAQELDACIPGPDFGWLDRVETEVERVGGTTTSAVVFQEAVLTKMKAELPSSYSYITAVNSVTTINEQNAILIEREKILTEALIKLQSIASEVGDISIDPDPGTENESKLIQAKQRYDSIVLEISTNSTITDAQNKLADAKDKLSSLSTLVTKCTAERTAKGWSNPGGANSIFGTAKGTVYTNTDEDNNY
ncbi:MAG: hypothetical protein AAB895_00655, partial [Patescibacteria group bacterium]